MNPHCRIGRVTPKGNLRLLPSPSAEGSADLVAALKTHAETIAGFYPGRMGGFVIVAWDLDGRWSRGIRLHKSSPVGTTMAPSFVADILRRDVAADVTREVLRGEA